MFTGDNGNVLVSFSKANGIYLWDSDQQRDLWHIAPSQ